MYKITVKGEASTNHKHLVDLDGIECQDEFSEYFNDDFTFKDNVENGYMYFKLENGKLYTYTVYHSDRELTEEELKQLMDYTKGQWSDGIGEGFEQFPVMEDDEGEEVYISPWFPGQNIKIYQEIIK